MTVHLVGAGPGDPELVTVRALSLIRSCDALVHDVLVAPELVAEAPSHAFVVSRRDLGQEEVNRLLVGYGRAGLEVVRLKGGDPFVFGRGSEEALALVAADIPFTIVPGVSSISAVPGAADIPVTHRGLSDTVTITTGSTATGGEPDYEALARAPGTLVVFMALGKLDRVADGLVGAGLDPATPAAVVARGTWSDQRAVAGPLSEIADRAAGLPSPALLVVGAVVDVAVALGRGLLADQPVAAVA